MTITSQAQLERERLIHSLYDEFYKNELKSPKDKKQTFFDESTGTYYCLTGKTRIPEHDIEKSKRYFREMYNECAGDNKQYDKAVCLSVALEAIEFMLQHKEEA